MLQSKNLSIKVAAKSQLSVYGADKAPEIQVSVNGSSLESPYLTYINVGYSGGQALTIDDFKTPVLIQLTSKSKLEHFRVSNQLPSDLNVSMQRFEGGVSFRPELLNAGDAFQLMLVTTGAVPEFTVQGRINGVSRLSMEELPSQNLSLVLPIVEFISCAMLMCCVLLFFRTKSEPSIIALSKGASFFVMLASITGVAVVGIHAAITHGLNTENQFFGWYFLVVLAALAIRAIVKSINGAVFYIDAFDASPVQDNTLQLEEKT